MMKLIKPPTARAYAPVRELRAGFFEDDTEGTGLVVK